MAQWETWYAEKEVREEVDEELQVLVLEQGGPHQVDTLLAVPRGERVALLPLWPVGCHALSGETCDALIDNVRIVVHVTAVAGWMQPCVAVVGAEHALVRVTICTWSSKKVEC